MAGVIIVVIRQLIRADRNSNRIDRTLVFPNGQIESYDAVATMLGLVGVIGIIWIGVNVVCGAIESKAFIVADGSIDGCLVVGGELLKVQV